MSKDVQERERINWIDLMKFVGIFAMVWGHCGVSDNIDIVIHVFHMPLFFWISGYLYEEDRFTVKKKWKSLLIPYFVYAAGIFLFWKFLGHFVDLPVYYGKKDFLRGLFWDNTMIAPYACIQWFLTCLFLTETIFHAVRRLVVNDRFLGIVLLGFSVLGYVYPRLTAVRLPGGLDCAFTAIAFYGSGYLMKKRQPRAEDFLKCHKSAGIVGTCLLFVVAAAAVYKNGYVNMRTLQYGSYFLYYLSATAIILLLVIMTAAISRLPRLKRSVLYKGILYIGRNTVIVLVMNQVFVQLIRWFFLDGFVEKSGINIYGADFLCAIFIIILMIPVSLAINRFVPFTIGRSYGNSREPGLEG